MGKSQELLQTVKDAEASGDTVKLEKLSRNDYKSVRTEAQKALNKIDGITDDKGKSTSKPVKKDDRQEESNKSSEKDWVKVTYAELKKYEEERRLVGYNPATGMAKLN